MPAIAAATAAAAIFAGASAAEEATETTTFGRDGIARPSLGVHFEPSRFSSVEARADGGLVAERDSGDFEGPNRIETFLGDGVPDPAAPPRLLPRYGRAFTLRSGKKLIVGNGKLTRINADGSADTSFGGIGTVDVTLGVESAAELRSGATVLVSSAVIGTHQRFGSISVALLNPDGSAGESYGFTVGPNQDLGVPEISPTPDGGALLVGATYLIELRADGSPNPNFSGDGLVPTLPMSATLAGGSVLPDGSVEVVGSSQSSGGNTDLALLRYTAAGTPDPGFDGDGVRSFDLGGEERANASLWAADGSVIVGGATQPPRGCFERAMCEEVPVLLAIDPEGHTQPGFGDGGALRLQGLAGISEDIYGSGVEDLARRADGSIVAAGTAGPERTTAFLAALSPSGALIPGFGEAGLLRLREPVPATQAATGLVPLADGGVLSAATTDLGFRNRLPALIRYGRDGGLDRSFGEGRGYVVLTGDNYVTSLAASASGELLVSVYDVPRSSLQMVRSADGAPVTSFAGDGVVGLPSEVLVQDLGFAEDGGALVVGSRRSGKGIVLHYRADGSRDLRFGRDGTFALRTPDGENMLGSALVRRPGARGTTLVGGASGHRFAIAAVRPDGEPDTRFGSEGWALAGSGRRPLTSGGGDIRPVAMAAKGAFVYLAGVTRAGGSARLVLLRFGADGRLDRDFGRRGRRSVPIAQAAVPTAVLPSLQGVFVVLGSGPRPLLFIPPDGRGGVRQGPVDPGARLVKNVRATTSRGQAVLGWTSYRQAEGGYAYMLARRSPRLP